MASALGSQTPDQEGRSVDARRALHAAIKARWSKFTDFELGALADNGDLVNQVSLKYDLELPRARAEVERLLKGRKV